MNREKMDRRTFGKRFIRYFLSISAIGLTGIGILFSFPGKLRKKQHVFIFVCNETELPTRGVRTFPITYQSGDRSIRKNIFLIKKTDALFSLSPVCSHLGCIVSWHPRKKRFLCPCHGGQYGMDGEVLEGPQPKPLARLPLKIVAEQVYVGVRI